MNPADAEPTLRIGLITHEVAPISARAVDGKRPDGCGADVTGAASAPRRRAPAGQPHSRAGQSAKWVPRPLVIAALLAGCGSNTTVQPQPDPVPAAITITAGNAQTAVVATTTPAQPRVRVTDGAGAGVPGVVVSFVATEGDGWVSDAAVTTDAAGYAATTWYLGPAPGTAQTLGASASGFSAVFTATATPLVEGTTYRGANDWVTFTPGDLPVIISAPHGGTQEPMSIPDRSAAGATTTRDLDTDLLALAMAPAFEARTGGTPHVVVLHLHRSKLDANRDLGVAAEGNRAAERAWREYHGFIEAARRHVIAEHGRGFYVDLHGHGHELQRLELGYLLTGAQLAGDDDALNAPAVVQRSSIRTLAGTGSASHAALLRGPESLGTLLEAEGYPAVPSMSQPSPGADPYFTGGYSTERHGSRDGGPIDGVQIEANRIGVRDTGVNREAFAAALARVIESYFAAHYGGFPSAAAVH